MTAAAILGDGSAPALVTAIEANMVEHFALFGRLPGAEVHDTPEMMWVLTGVPHPVMNGVFRTQLALAALDRKVGEALGAIRSRGAPARWVIGPSTRPADLGRYLEVHGLPYTRAWIGMAADLGALDEAVEAPAGLALDEVTDLDGLRSWTAAYTSGSHVPEALGDAFFGVFARSGVGRDLPVRHYLARVDGRPVATTTLFLSAGVAGIYWVYTVPEARRQGIGTALVLAALRAARADGYRFGVLHATQMGEGVYRRIGFEALCRLDIHVFPGRCA